MDGITGKIPETHKGILHYECIYDDGSKVVLEDEGTSCQNFHVGCLAHKPTYRDLGWRWRVLTVATSQNTCIYVFLSIKRGKTKVRSDNGSILHVFM